MDLILLGAHNYESEQINAVFQLFIENCNNLSEIIVLNHISLNKSISEEFHQKFGPKIKSFGSLKKFFDLNRFPKVEKIRFELGQSIIAELKLDKLKQLEIVFNRGQERMLQRVIEKFPNLTHFDVVFNSRDENAIYKPLKNISNLKHLIHFKLNNEFGTIDHRFYDILKQMANNCQNLKSFECRICIIVQNSEILHFFRN